MDDVEESKLQEDFKLPEPVTSEKRRVYALDLSVASFSSYSLNQVSNEMILNRAKEFEDFLNGE